MVQFHTETLSRIESVLHEEACLRATDYRSAEALLLEVIIEVDRLKLYRKFALRSTFSYCVDVLKLSECVAFNFITVARKCREVPALMEAIMDEQLSVPKARKITSVLTNENQNEWILKATTISKAQLEKEVAKASPESAAKEAFRVRSLGNGYSEVKMIIKDEVIEQWRRAQDIEALGPVETFEKVLSEHLKKIDPLKKAERNLKKAGRILKKSEKSSSRDLSQEFSPVSTQELSQATSRESFQNSCRVLPQESSLVSSQESSQVLSRELHRDSSGRSIPLQVQHQLNLRDQRACQALRPNGSKCGERRYLQFHHIVPVSRGGLSTLGNLLTLCSACHRLWHARND